MIMLCIWPLLVWSDEAPNTEIGSQATGSKKDAIDELSERLIALRGEVEDLSAELLLAREEQKQRLSALATQKNDLQAKRKREQLNQEKLRQTLERNRQAALDAGADSELITPILLNAIHQLKKEMQTRLPFKLDERIAELDRFRNQVTSGALAPSRAANRLWAFYEDEIQLNRENGIYRQTITLNDERLLVEVARLGMALLYFRTEDERYGYAKRTDNEWKYHLIEDGAGIKQVAYLFDSLEKQIRTGFFQLPNPL